MAKKWIVITVLTMLLVGTVVWEQVYTDNALHHMKTEITYLKEEIDAQNLAASKERIGKLIDEWNHNEAIICLFVDYRDIEQIGKQVDLVSSHLENEDFELALVECNTLERVVDNFVNMVSVDFPNIL